MKCKTCNTKEVVKINKEDNVKFQCVEGHIWYEDYVDNGGPHQRPASYEIKLDDVLFPKEKKLYQKVLNEIARNEGFFIGSSPEEITDYLINNCNFDKMDIYRLFKKITKHGGTS